MSPVETKSCCNASDVSFLRSNQRSGRVARRCQSGGKRLKSKTREGNTWLRGILGEVAWAISRKNDNYLSAQYHRLARRRGKLKAAVAVSHSVLVIAYHVLKEQNPYQDLGKDYFDKLDRDRLQRHHVHRLEALGYEVSLTPKAA